MSADDMKTRAESVSVPSRVHGLTGAEWAAKVLADPMRTLPPGAGYLIAQALRELKPDAPPTKIDEVLLELNETMHLYVSVTPNKSVIFDDVVRLEQLPRVIELLTAINAILRLPE